MQKELLIRQNDKPCICGNWYNRNDMCIVCGCKLNIPESFYIEDKHKFVPVRRGKEFDKKKT